MRELTHWLANVLTHEPQTVLALFKELLSTHTPELTRPTPMIFWREKQSNYGKEDKLTSKKQSDESANSCWRGQPVSTPFTKPCCGAMRRYGSTPTLINRTHSKYIEWELICNRNCNRWNRNLSPPLNVGYQIVLIAFTNGRLRTICMVSDDTGPAVVQGSALMGD